MEEIIDRNISKNEVIVRFIFKGDIKNNKYNLEYIKENIIEKDVFVDTRPNVDVSLLRKRYNSDDDCVNRGKKVKNDFVGYLYFKKDDFDKIVTNQKQISQLFEAEIISTPLDENHQIIPKEKIVFINTPINPGHADLKYMNPGLITDDENPNTAIRRFSRNLFKICEVYFEDCSSKRL